MLFSYSFKSILDFQTAKDLLKIQQLNRYLYETFIPNYFATCKERKNNLMKLKIGNMINREAILLFQGQSQIYKNNYYPGDDLYNTDLKWEKTSVDLRMSGNSIEKFKFNQDWAKAIPLWNNLIFVSGGSTEEGTGALWMRNHTYSSKTFIINTRSGIVKKKQNMKIKRQAHGLVRINNYVYACGGLDNISIIDTCERFNLTTEKWSLDVPSLKEAKFSMTMMALDKTWIYSFGGATNDF